MNSRNLRSLLLEYEQTCHLVDSALKKSPTKPVALMNHKKYLEALQKKKEYQRKQIAAWGFGNVYRLEYTFEGGGKMEEILANVQEDDVKYYIESRKSQVFEFGKVNTIKYKYLQTRKIEKSLFLT